MKFTKRMFNPEYKGANVKIKTSKESKLQLDGVLSMRELVRRNWAGLPTGQTTHQPLYLGVEIENGLDLIEKIDRIKQLENKINNYRDSLIQVNKVNKTTKTEDITEVKKEENKTSK